MGELGILENGGLFAEDGRIVCVGPTREIESLVRPDTHTIDASNCVVLPGFVDAHTHLVFGGNRVEEYEQRASGKSYEEIAASGGGIRRTVGLTRGASEEELLAQAKKHAGWFLAGGTTTVEAKSGYGLSLEDELKILRVARKVGQDMALSVVPTFLGAHAFPPEFQDDHRGYVELVVEQMLPAVQAEGLAEFCDVFCERNYFSLDESRMILKAAKARGLGLRIHADQLTCNGGAQLAAELGARTADHLEQTGSDGIAAMRAAGVQPVLLPGSVYALGHERYPKGREMIDAGLAVVLASDFNPGSSPTTSMAMVLSLACTHMKLSPAEALCAATVNAAYSLNRGDQIGSLEAGKAADFTVFECGDYREIPYYFGVNLVRQVFSKGERLRVEV